MLQASNIDVIQYITINVSYANEIIENRIFLHLFSLSFRKIINNKDIAKKKRRRRKKKERKTHVIRFKSKHRFHTINKSEKRTLMRVYMRARVCQCVRQT